MGVRPSLVLWKKQGDEKMSVMGIDIGTTTISVIMMDDETGKLLDSMTIPHKSFLKGRFAFNRIQDPGIIWKLTKDAVKEIIRKHGHPKCIGMTGQMHGFLYVDQKGDAVSPLYTWQDGSGNEFLPDGRTSVEILLNSTGSASSGYGLITHYYLLQKDMIPDRAEKMTTVSDYIAMKLCGLKTPFISADMAASWGCFDLELGDFCRQELEELDMDLKYLPEILGGHPIVGVTAGDLPKNIPVIVSLGDNQASVLGSVKDLSGTVLINIGTGSQVSFGTEKYVNAGGSIELRPCTNKQYLMVGSGLCGGRAYAMLERFYREIAGKDQTENMYQKMEQQAREFMDIYGKEASWKIKTTFSGTRSNPGERGVISSVSVENFYPGAMTLGMIQGILGELKDMYDEMCRMTGTKAVNLVGSGNGLRRNSLMCEMAEDIFRMDMKIPACSEEAAYGAALQALVSSGFEDSLEKAQKKIQYL